MAVTIWGYLLNVKGQQREHRTLIPCHLTNIALRLGRKLQWDPKREEFVGDSKANAQLRRTQRAPYQIKEM
jgi:hypothetical protein